MLATVRIASLAVISLAPMAFAQSAPDYRRDRAANQTLEQGGI